METLKDKTPSQLIPKNFRIRLQQELLFRCRKNEGYSLRAFARSLQIEPSALSQILSGKRSLTSKMKMRLGTALGLSTKELGQMQSSETAQKEGSQAFQYIKEDSFAIISEWYHYAILELTYLADFKSDINWVCRKLGISKSEANFAVERLFHLKLLVLDENKEWKDNSENGNLSHIGKNLTSVAAKANQAQLLELSKKSLLRDSIEIRNHTSAAFCFESKDFAEAVQAIAKFRRKFAKDFQPKTKGNQVYQMQISFFPLTKNEI